MKRISIGLVLLVLSPGVSKAWYAYGCGVRYSPYALTYHHSGLISGGVAYTPYALSYHSSGLVAGYGVCDNTFGLAVPATSRYTSHVRSSAHIGISAEPQPAAIPAPAPDGLNTIRQYLLARGVETASVNHILRIDNRLVGVDFTLAEQKLVIRYWDPKEIEQLSSRPAHVQRLYEQHRQVWENYARQCQQTGSEVYCVEASDPQAIVASLQSCPRLDPGSIITGQSVMYARD